MKQLLKRLITRPQQQLRQLAARNQLALDPAANLPGLPVLDAIFTQREYADYFPFYRDATVVDVGAHFGYFSLFAAQHLGAAGRIYAVEPVAANFEVLRRNLADNAATAVTAIQLAMAGATGEQTMYLGRAENHSLLGGYALSDDTTGIATVPTVTLADFLQQHRIDRVDFLKMDCEGAEYGILEGAPPAVLARVQTISLEFHDLRSAVHNGATLCQLLKTNGYRIVRFTHEPTRRNLNYGKILATRD